MAQKNTSSPTALRTLGAHDQKTRKGHATHRELRGADRRAERREWREAIVIVLHPSLFERQVEAA
jgi:hypothetical protein